MNIRLYTAAFALLAASPSIALAADSSPVPSAAASPAAAAAPSAAPEDPAVTAAVKKQYAAIESGKINRADYSAEFNAQLTDSMLSSVSSQLQQFGPPTKFTYVTSAVRENNHVYIYSVDTAKAKLQMLYAVDQSGKISGLFLRPAP